MRLFPLCLIRAAITILLLVSASFSAAANAAAPADPVPTPLVVSEPGLGAVPLNGLWQFHTGDDRAWSQPGFDDSTWESLTADRPWGLQGHPGYSGIAWYRRHVAFRPDSAGAASLRLLLPDVEQAYEVYWNGVLVGHCGKLPPGPVWAYKQLPHIFPLPAGNSGAGSSEGGNAGVLAVRVWRAPPLSDEDAGLRAGFMAEPLVGTPGAIANAKAALDFKWLNGRQFLFTESLVYALMALLSGLVWLRYRDQWLLLWMAGFTLMTPLLVLLLDARLPVPYAVAMALTQPLVSMRDISLWFLLLWLLDLRTDKMLSWLARILAWISLGVNVIDGIFCAIIGDPRLARLAQTGDAVATVVNGITVLFPLLLAGVALKRRKKLDRSNLLVALAALLMEMVIVVRNAIEEGSRFTHWQITDLTDGPLVAIGGSSVSLMDMLKALLLASLVYAVYSSVLQHRKRQIVLVQEMRNASELQRMIVPDAPVELPGFRFCSAFQPAQEVGGDFFQVIPTSGQSALVVLGDVSGKGLKAAMSVAFIVGAIRGLSKPDMRPSELLCTLNQRLIGRLGGGFATCLAIRIERDGRCLVASAGHPAPFIDDEEMELEGSLPLGLVSAAEYEDRVFDLQPGQSCILFTDGLLEARAASGELYGYERLKRLFAGRPNADQAAQAGVDFGQDDDITVLAFARLAERTPVEASAQGTAQAKTIGAGEAPAAVTG